MKAIKIMFVCTGNICRSPTAHGVFRKIVQAENLESYFKIESSGTHSSIWHKGEGADCRSIEIALKYNCDIRDIKSKQLLAVDFFLYDYLIAMDDKNYNDMKVIGLGKNVEKIRKLLDYAPQLIENNVPDPYYSQNFEEVYLMIETACKDLFKDLKRLM